MQIDLPDGRYAYGRVYRDASIGIYSQRSSAPRRPPVGSRDFMFIVGVYDTALRGWTVVGSDPFSLEEDRGWPPANYIKDVLSGEYSIYYRGEMRPSSAGACRGLEEAAVWDGDGIVDRIMGFKGH